MKNNVSLVFGSGRFASLVCNNTNEVMVGQYDRPTKLVSQPDKDVMLCLPADLTRWGLYPTHQESWLGLAFIIACHSRHNDEAGLAIRQAAWEAIPAQQWPALAAKASEFAVEFRQRLNGDDLSQRKLYKSLTRALQDCVLYLAAMQFPQDQDVFLAASPVAALIERANAGRRGELTNDDGLALADEVDALVASLVAEHGGIETCRQALAELTADARPGRVILLPEGMTLNEGADLVSFDIVIGTPDEHDIDVVSIVGSEESPRLVQFKDELSGQRMDVMAVSKMLGPADELTGGHPAFQSVAEMLLANGTPVTDTGTQLITRLSGQVDPVALARKYRDVAKDFFHGNHRKSWVGRRVASNVAQVKKVIPLYRIACDLLPRAAFMERTGAFPGGKDMAELAKDAGLGDVYIAIRSILDRQDASQEELESIAARIAAHLSSLS